MNDETYIEDADYEIIPARAEIPAEVEIVRPEDMGYQDSVDIIRESMQTIKQSFIQIGWYLRHIRNKKLYQEDGYQSIVDFAEDKLHMSKTTVFRLIKIVEQFAMNDASLSIDKEYADYSYSQLIEILPMKPEERKTITPDMPVGQIREAKKRIRAERRDGSVSVETEVLEENYMTAGDYDAKTGAFLPATGEQKPELPELSNKDERMQWLQEVEAWGLWYEDANIEARYYKYDFPDGSRLIAVKYRYTCPPNLMEQPERYREQIEADGTYYEAPVYHMIYSENYLEEHINEYSKKYKRYYTNDTVSINELEKFLKWIQGVKDSSAVRYVEFDTTRLGEEENKDRPYITRQYIKFYKKYGYIPEYFNVKNCSEFKDYAPTLTTSSGSFTGIGSIAIFHVGENLQEIEDNHNISDEECVHEVVKLVRIASQEEREKIKDADRLLEVAKLTVGKIGKVRFKITKLSAADCFKLMGLTKEDVEKGRKVGVSEAQLTKQAGNGIVTNCVSHLMEHLYQAQYDPSHVCTDEKLTAKNQNSKRKK